MFRDHVHEGELTTNLNLKYIASDFQYLHDFNIVHRDVNPHNIGFYSNRKVKIFDLGSAQKILPFDKFGRSDEEEPK